MRIINVCDSCYEAALAHRSEPAVHYCDLPARCRCLGTHLANEVDS